MASDRFLEVAVVIVGVVEVEHSIVLVARTLGCVDELSVVGLDKVAAVGVGAVVQVVVVVAVVADCRAAVFRHV